jgi:dTMP kinase
MRGRFIVFEGIDGAGKSSHLAEAMEILSIAGKDPLLTREPGGTVLGETLRDLLLNQPMTAQTECLLMFAARQQHIQETIEPAVAAGRWVLCDRFTDSTYAYQGGGRGFDVEKIRQLETWVQADFAPDHVLLFDLDPAEAARRRAKARAADKFESEDLAFFSRVREAYHERAAQKPWVYHFIDSALPPEIVKVKVSNLITSICF